MSMTPPKTFDPVCANCKKPQSAHTPDTSVGYLSVVLLCPTSK